MRRGSNKVSAFAARRDELQFELRQEVAEQRAQDAHDAALAELLANPPSGPVEVRAERIGGGLVEFLTAGVASTDGPTRVRLLAIEGVLLSRSAGELLMVGGDFAGRAYVRHHLGLEPAPANAEPPDWISEPAGPVFDTDALLPALRQRPTRARVALLAGAMAHNAVQFCRWRRATGVDLSNPTVVGALPSSSPLHFVVRAENALAVACRQHQAETGEDGLELARATVAGAYGAAWADHVLADLVDIAEAGRAYKARTGTTLLAFAGFAAPGLETAGPMTPDELRLAVDALSQRTCREPDAWLVVTSLELLRASIEAHVAAGDGTPAHTAPDVLAAFASVERACQRAVRRGDTPDRLRQLVSAWQIVTGGPHVEVNVQPARGALVH